MIWDGTGDNPCDGFLALADAIVVTVDSINMTTEAAATGKPVYTVELEGGSAKFFAFHKRMRESGVTRPFVGQLEKWTYPICNDPSDIAAEIRRRLAERAVVFRNK
jgi:mitochondrial fission protein ELM1